MHIENTPIHLERRDGSHYVVTMRPHTPLGWLGLRQELERRGWTIWRSRLLDGQMIAFSPNGFSHADGWMQLADL